MHGISLCNHIVIVAQLNVVARVRIIFCKSTLFDFAAMKTFI